MQWEKNVNVDEFIGYVENGFQRLRNTNEQLFIDYIKILKLKGNVESCWGDIDHHTLAEFIDDLLRIYSRKIVRIGVLLDGIYQFPEESVIHYKNRFLKLVMRTKG